MTGVLQLVAIIAVGGMVVWGIALVVVLGRYARVIDEHAADARYLRSRLIGEVTRRRELEQLLERRRPPAQAPIPGPQTVQTTGPRPGRDDFGKPLAEPEATVTRTLPEVPPIAQSTGEQPVLPRTRPARARRSAEATDA